MFTKDLHLQNGYSLLELSVVLAILAVFAGGLATFLGSDQKGRNIHFTSSQLAEIDDGIKRYFAKNGHIPCPASITTAESSASFGNATDCTAAAPAGTTDMNAVSAQPEDQIRIGMVPFRELGMSPRHAYDAWNNRIGYAVVKNLATSENTYTEFITTSTNGIIRVLDAPSGDLLIPGNTSTYIAYVLYSQGSDNRGAYGPTAALYLACGAPATADSENCDDDDVFLDMNINETTTAANYFNDFVRWATNDDLAIFEENAQ